MIQKKWDMKELIRVSGSFWETCTLQTAVQLDIFTVLSASPSTCRQVAKKLNVPLDGLCRLLNALVSMQLLEKTGDRYANTAESRAFLSKDSKEYTGFLLKHHHQLSKSWSRMDEAITSGKPFRANVQEMDKEETESFIMSMHNTASFHAPIIVDKVDLSNNRRLLDLGGGPGTFAIHFCKHYP
ncbi:MAG: SAM-dependent methyltransferase, partial [bacterium]|nr:SAM-dependent methyltransferase [bacterium]